MSLMTVDKDPVKVRAGTIGSRVRWGIPHSVSLRQLTDDQREFVIELVEELRQAALARRLDT